MSEQGIRDELLARIAELDERADELRGRRSEISTEIAELDREVAQLRRRLRQLEPEGPVPPSRLSGRGRLGEATHESTNKEGEQQ